MVTSVPTQFSSLPAAAASSPGTIPATVIIQQQPAQTAAGMRMGVELQSAGPSAPPPSAGDPIFADMVKKMEVTGADKTTFARDFLKSRPGVSPSPGQLADAVTKVQYGIRPITATSQLRHIHSSITASHFFRFEPSSAGVFPPTRGFRRCNSTLPFRNHMQSRGGGVERGQFLRQDEDFKISCARDCRSKESRRDSRLGRATRPRRIC